MNSTKIKVLTHEYTVPREKEAFDVFRRLQQQFGPTSAFLLDSITDLKNRFCSSVIGFNPLVNCRIHGSRFDLSGSEPIVQKIKARLQDKGIAGPEFGNSLTTFLDTVQGSFDVSDNTSRHPYSFGFLGYFSYDAVRYYEEIPATVEDDRQLDDVFLQIHQVVLHFESDLIRIVINEVEGVNTPSLNILTAYLNENRSEPFAGFDSGKLQIVEDVSQNEYVERVHRAQEYIREGDIFQVVLSKRDRVIGHIDPLLVYKRLKDINPSPYMFYVDYGDYRLFGASPEMHLRVENGIATMRPIAGTTKGKGRTIEENAQLVENLLNDEKEKAEHVMLVDLCRNDLGKFCKPGSIQVHDYMKVEEFSHVFHAVSTVQGSVESGVSMYEAFLTTFPAGTLSGAPKIRAMEIIDELETLKRGAYGGAVGFFDFNGNMNTAIIIRSVIHQDDTSYLQAGAGIVADSVSEQEWNECNHKLRALVTTVFS